MEKLRGHLRRFFDFSDRERIDVLETRLTALDSQISEINSYLRDISQLANYVKDKDEKQDEVFRLLNEARGAATSKTREELEDDLLALTDLKLSVENGQAIGRQEIENKNRSVIQIETEIQKVKHALHGNS